MKQHLLLALILFTCACKKKEAQPAMQWPAYTLSDFHEYKGQYYYDSLNEYQESIFLDKHTPVEVALVIGLDTATAGHHILLYNGDTLLEDAKGTYSGLSTGTNRPVDVKLWQDSIRITRFLPVGGMQSWWTETYTGARAHR